jgi:hypothetical protein
LIETRQPQQIRREQSADGNDEDCRDQRNAALLPIVRG